jgi:magnesium transporter
MSQALTNHLSSGAARAPELELFLSALLGARVTLGGRKVGRLTDLVIKETTSLPIVTQLCVSLPYGESALVPWEKVGTLTPKEVSIDAPDIAAFRGEPADDAVLLRDHILDKKAIDMEGRELEVVYDVKLALRNRRLYVTDVDLSRNGLLRRMGLGAVAGFIYSLAESIREQTVSWKYIQPLPEHIGRFRGDVRLNVLKEKLADIDRKSVV